MSPSPEALSVDLLNFGFWPEVQRGSERISHDLAVDLVAMGHCPRMITSHPGRSSRSIEDGFEIVRNWRPPEGLLTRRGVEPHLSHVAFSYRSLIGGDADVAHAFYPTDALAALRWGRRTGRRTVFSYMGIPQRSVLSTNRRRMEILDRVMTDSDAVVALSCAARDQLWRWFRAEAEIVYPGVDLDAFSPGGQRSPVPTIACAAAVDDSRKRIGLLARGFARVRRERPDARLVLMRPTDPRLMGELRTVSDGIEFFEPDVRGIASVFREAWVSGLTSYNEAFGVVLVESLACGTPVFGAADGGVPEIISSDDIGRTFSPDGDETDVATTLLEVLELAEAPGTAGAARKRAEAFDTRSGAVAYEQIYRGPTGS